MATDRLTVEDYNKRLQKTNSLEGGTGERPQTTANEDYFQMARDQEFGMLFDKEVALENAKANAQKYTQNQSPLV